MIRILLAILLISSSLFFISCSSPGDTKNDELISAVDDIESEEDEDDDEEYEDSDEADVVEADDSDEDEDSDELADSDDDSDDDFEEDDEVAENDDADEFEEDDSEEAAEEVAENEGNEFEEDSLEEIEEEPTEELVAEDTAEPVGEELMAEEEAPTEEVIAEESDFEEPEVDDFAAAGADVTGIQYLANQNGGTVLIETSEPVQYQTRTNPDTNQFVVEITGANLPEKLKRPYLMKDFKGAFGAINAYQNAGSSTVRIVVQQKGAGEPVVQQEGNSLMVIPGGTAVAENDDSGTEVAMNEAPKEPEQPEPVEPAPPANDVYQKSFSSAEDRALGARSLDEFLTGNNRFYGRNISIEFSKDADIRDVINFIAEQSGVNLVMADDVKGALSIKLRKVPWDQALVLIMRAKKLGYVRQGTVIRIATLDSLRQETTTAKAMIEAQKQLAPLRVKVIPVSFSKVESLEKQVLAFLTPSRGKVVADTRTSSLIITDTDEKLKRIGRLIKELDIPPAQVMIEGKIIEAQEDFNRTLGVAWNTTGTPISLGEGKGADKTDLAMRADLGVQPLAQDIAVASVGNIGLNIGTLNYLGDLNATISLAEANNLVKIISSPRIVAMNKEEAEISQKGEVLTVSTVNNNGVTTSQVQRTPVELKLVVTPQVTADGSVILDVNVKREFAGPVEDEATNARAVNSRTAKTKILVVNGQTAVIGGIYQNDQTENKKGIPGLMNIPVLGWLFKSETSDRRKNELLIFLTPRVLNIKDQQAKGV